MILRLILVATLALGVLFGTTVAHENKGKKPRKIDPQWMSYKHQKGPFTMDRRDHGKKKHSKKGEIFDLSVMALRGPSATDVILVVETDDPEKYPIPEEFEKIQIKILNQFGKVVEVKKFRDVAITDGEAVVSIADLYPPKTIKVQAEVKIRRKRAEILRGDAVVLFRPDLVVDHVQAPEMVGPDEPFNIQATIREVKLQSDVTANVNLCEGATVLATASGVYVPAGSQVTVFFEAVTLADAGNHDLSIKITDAVPAEFDTGNNELAFSVMVGSPVQPVNYTLTYRYTKNYVSSYGYIDCEGSDLSNMEGSFTTWDLVGFLPFTTVSPVDSIRWEAVTGTGSLTHGFISDWTPLVSNVNIDYYNAFMSDVDGSNLYLTMFVYKTTGQTNLNISKVANNYFYVQIYNGDTTNVYYEESHQGDLVDFLEVRFLFADDGQLAGGAARADLAPFVFESQDYSEVDDYDPSCIYQYVDITSSDVSTAFVSGVTNPSVLPTGAVKATTPIFAESIVPQSTDLVQNYPNPFNPSTNIQFTVDHTGPAVLKVYDMLGKEVAELYRGMAEQGQTYRFTFQASGFASGMYYAKLDAGGKQYTKKMLLMK